MSAPYRPGCMAAPWRRKAAPEQAAAALASAPIFVGGDHRSGTTLLSVVLDSHPSVVCGPELDFLEPEDLGPHVLACIGMLVESDPRVLGRGVETADPQWRLGVQFVKQCHRFGITPETLRGLVEEQVCAASSSIRWVSAVADSAE